MSEEKNSNDNTSTIEGVSIGMISFWRILRESLLLWLCIIPLPILVAFPLQNDDASIFDDADRCLRAMLTCGVFYVIFAISFAVIFACAFIWLMRINGKFSLRLYVYLPLLLIYVLGPILMLVGFAVYPLFVIATFALLIPVFMFGASWLSGLVFHISMLLVLYLYGKHVYQIETNKNRQGMHPSD